MLRAKYFWGLAFLGWLSLAPSAPARADEAATCARNLKQLHITAPIDLPRPLAARLRDQFSGQCASQALARRVSIALGRELAALNIAVKGLDYQLDEQTGTLKLRLGGAKNLIVRMSEKTPPRVRFAEIIGTAEQDNELQLRVAVSGDENQLRVQWLRDGLPIDGATGVNFKLGAQDVGAQLSARIHMPPHIKGDGQTPIADIFETGKTALIGAAMTPPTASAPRIVGRARVGAQLTATYIFQAGRKSQTQAATNYQWLRDGLPIKGATKANYRLSSRDIGAQISVSITPRDRNGQTGQSVRSALAATIAPPLSLVQTRPVPRPVRDRREQTARDMAHIRRLIRDADLSEARAQLVRFVDENPSLLSGRLMLARVLIQLDNIGEAETLLTDLVTDERQSETGQATAERLLRKLQAVRFAAERREKQRRGETSITVRQRFGTDRNVRRAAQDGEIRYYLGNLSSLAGLNIDSILAPAPGVVNADEDSQKDEIYFDSMASLSHSWKNRFGRGETLSLSAMASKRSYDTYDDNNDGTGDGDYELLMLRSGGTLPYGGVVLGGNLSFTQLALGGETASRTTELSGDVIMPLPRKNDVTDLVSLSLAYQINNADPLEVSSANAARSGHGWRLQSAYQAQRGAWQLKGTGGLSAQSHNNEKLDFTNFSLGAQAARGFGDWQLGTGLSFTKRVNAHMPSADDFDAIWGMRRRRDDTLGVQLSLSHPLRFSWGDILLSLDMSERFTESNLERYDMQTGDIGLNANYHW